MNGRALTMLLAAVSSTFILGQADMYSLPECDSESALKLSKLFALHYHQRSKLKHLREKLEPLNSTLKAVESIDMAIDNLTSPEFIELELSQVCTTNIPRDCYQIKQMFPSAKSGLYAIRDPCNKLFTTSRLTVNCDMETDGGGWTIIQRRNASMGWVNFARSWADYEKGFGDLDGEFWIGLKNIHELTNQQRMSLRLSVWNNTVHYVNWNYPFFRISDGSGRYALMQHIGVGSGEGSDTRAFTHEGHTNYYFTTVDYFSGNRNCGYRRQSGWWYYNGICAMTTNPNGLHQPSGLRDSDAAGERLVYRNSTKYHISTHSEMKICPQLCQGS